MIFLRNDTTFLPFLESIKMIMDEITLIAECVKGNARAQKMLFDKFASKMLTVCRRYFPNKMEAEDILQDGFVKVFQHLENYQHKGSFEGWMRRIFANTALDELRKRKDFLEEKDVSDLSYKLDASISSDDAVQADDLLRMIQALPTGYRIVFNLFAIEGYSHKEIAKKLKISENTSKSQYFRAKAILKAHLEKLNFER